MKINITLEQALAKASPSLREKMTHIVELLRNGEPLALRYNRGRFSVGVNAGGEDVNAESQLTDEQIEREVAEAIFDWWISQKSYRRWYADRYLQQELNFGE